MTAAAIAVTGWAFGAGSFRPLAAALAPGLTLEVLTPAALPGDGGTGPSGAGRGYAAGLCRRIAAADRAPILIGWSMGAIVALEAALLCPRRVAALVLVSATGRFCRAPGYPSGMPARLLEAMIARLASQPAAVVRDFIGRVFLPDTVDDVTRDALAGEALTWGAADLAAGLRHLVETDLRDRLDEVACPVLIVHGDQDRIVPAAAAARLHEGLVGSRLEIVGGAGHALPVCAAERLGERVLAFLRGLPRR
jgi:pimeloyl-[acyl-carrier protein] methyl ester esterase